MSDACVQAWTLRSTVRVACSKHAFVEYSMFALQGNSWVLQHAPPDVQRKDSTSSIDELITSSFQKLQELVK